MNAILKNIRTDLRLAMNGIASTSMREKGLNYKMNFGVDILKLRQIAAKYAPDAALAEMLWREDTRELKILATMLRPSASLSAETADRWCAEIPNQEIREQACMNLFQHAAHAPEMAMRWAANSDEGIRCTGYWLYARLAIAKADKLDASAETELTRHALNDVHSDAYRLRMAAQNTLKFIGRKSPNAAREILSSLNDFQHENDAARREIFEALRFEFENCLYPQNQNAK